MFLLSSPLAEKQHAHTNGTAGNKGLSSTNFASVLGIPSESCDEEEFPLQAVYREYCKRNGIDPESLSGSGSGSQAGPSSKPGIWNKLRK